MSKIPYYRTFNGKRYRARSSHKTQGAAIKMAEVLQKEDCLTQIITDLNRKLPYTVYLRRIKHEHS